MPTISVIIPVYNAEKSLAKCLNSFVNQTFKDIEIIIVDDGSPDNSAEIYKKYAEKDSRVKYIKQKNAGVSEARNTGMQIASGDFFMFADPDDWAELNACEILYNEYLKTKADLIVADVTSYTDGKPSRNRVFKSAFTTHDSKIFKAYQKACIGYCYNPYPAVKWNISGLGSPWNKLFKKDIIQKYDLKFDPYVMGVYDDNLFTLYYLMHVKSVSYVNIPIYNFCIEDESLTQSYRPNTLEINRRIFERINEFIDKTGDREFFEEAFYVYVIRRFSKSLNVYFFADNNGKTKKEICTELKQTMKSEPYRTAIKEVDIRKLLNNHKVVVFLAKIGMPSLLRICIKIKNIIMS